MALPAIFISHCPDDSAYCEALSAELRAVGHHVWYESHGANPPQPPELIARELGQRPVYLALLSPAMLRWRQGENDFDWARQRYWRDPYTFSVMTVVAAPCDEGDLWPPLREFYRIEREPLQPSVPAQAASRVRLALAPAGPELLATLLPGNPLPQPSAEIHAMLAQGYALVSQGQRRAAIEVYRRATEADPQAIAAWNTLGLHLLDSNRDEEARTVFERALKIDPTNMFARTGWANSFALSQPAKALELIDPLLVEWPRNALALDGRAVALLGLKRTEEGLASVSYALALAPTFATGWNNKGVALGRLDRIGEAFAAYQRSLALDPGHIAAWSNRGTLYNKLKRYPEALGEYDHALSLDPTFAPAWTNRANELINLGRNDEALASCDRAIALNPSMYITWSLCGVALKNLKRYPEALEAADRALELNPDDAMAWQSKAAVLSAMKRYEEALAAVEHGLTREPDRATAWNLRGMCLFYLGRYDEALANFDRALAIKPEPAMWRNKAAALVKLGRALDAVRAQREATLMEQRASIDL